MAAGIPNRAFLRRSAIASFAQDSMSTAVKGNEEILVKKLEDEVTGASTLHRGTRRRDGKFSSTTTAAA